jgi:hypothetical protein
MRYKLSLPMRRFVVLLLVALNGCNAKSSCAVTQRTVEAPGKLIRCDQGWSDSDAEWFYNVSQGSQLIPYAWISSLQTEDGSELFIKSIPKFGYIPRTASPDNPLGLPVGFVKDQGIKREWLGLNCSACHTAIIEHGDNSFLIDGGQALSDVQGLMMSLDSALAATLTKPDRFAAFAKSVLGREESELKRKELEIELDYVAKKRKGYSDRNMPKAGDPQFGYARVDAIGAILNEVTERFLERPDNHKVADAPVSYPCLWDTPHHDRVEWNGSAPNTILDLGNLARNTGEVLGVFGDLEIPVDAPIIGYRSTVQFDSLREIEAKLKRLKSPVWPAEIPRKTDAATLTAGKGHFDRLCSSCHQFSVGDRNAENRRIIAKMDDVGTDPNMARNFRERRAKTGKLEGTRINFNPIGGRFPAEVEGQTVLVHAIVGAIAGGFKDAPPDELDRLKTREPELKAREADNKYKGRPLNGIWATAPYLHNGSVPTLRDLLRPTDDRPKVFYVGSRKFNPTDVGFESGEAPGTFKFDATLPGNLRNGHEYGTGVAKNLGGDGEKLSPTQMDELLEYLKSL